LKVRTFSSRRRHLSRFQRQVWSNRYHNARFRTNSQIVYTGTKSPVSKEMTPATWHRVHDVLYHREYAHDKHNYTTSTQLRGLPLERLSRKASHPGASALLKLYTQCWYALSRFQITKGQQRRFEYAFAEEGCGILFETGIASVRSRVIRSFQIPHTEQRGTPIKEIGTIFQSTNFASRHLSVFCERTQTRIRSSRYLNAQDETSDNISHLSEWQNIIISLGLRDEISEGIF
jgi:hypothetical protein